MPAKIICKKAIFQLSGYRSNDAEKNDYMTSWDAVNKELISSEDFGEQLKKNVRIDELQNPVDKMHTPEQKMAAVYNYVRHKHDMEW